MPSSIVLEESLEERHTLYSSRIKKTKKSSTRLTRLFLSIDGDIMSKSDQGLYGENYFVAAKKVLYPNQNRQLLKTVRRRVARKVGPIEFFMAS